MILVKSTSVTVNIDNSELIASNGILFHTVLNSDRMGNFLSEGDNYIKDEQGRAKVRPITLNMKNMVAMGNILHDDFQRNMMVNLSRTVLRGSIKKGIWQSWSNMWYGRGISEANWLKDKTWSGTNELNVVLDAHSKWLVIENAFLSKLKIEKGATIAGDNGKKVIVTVDGKTTPIKAGNYLGMIELIIQ